VTATGFDIEFGLPEDLHVLTLSADSEQAASQLRTFAAQRNQETAYDGLAAARAFLQTDSVVWNGVLRAPIDGRSVPAVFGVSVRPLRPGESARTIAAEATRRFAGDAVVEPFPTRHGEAVGVRRIGTLLVADDELTTAVAQVACAFADVGGCATVTGVALSLDDLDVTTLVVGAIADTVRLMRRD
jgi:hypothetical protein